MTCRDCIYRSCPDFKDRSKFIELPCKMGERVFSFCELYHEICEYKISKIHISENAVGEDIIVSFEAFFAIEDELISDIDFEIADIGKTVFLTREEAERALEEAEQK